MSTFIRRRKAARVRLDQSIGLAFRDDDLDDRTRHTFGHLVYLVRSRSDLLRPTGAVGFGEHLGHVNVVIGLLAMASHRDGWLRPPDEWEPSGAGPWPRFASLASHLFARYPMPAFMASAWSWSREPEARRRQGWYRHMGLGRNIRTADVPLELTKKMAHEFTLAPDHFSIDMALRWGQVRGLGGSKHLARAVVATRLGRTFEHEDFWRTVVHFFVNHPELALEHVGPIVDYLHNRRFVPQEASVEEGDLSPEPPQPDLSMKGRTPRSLLRQLGEWHEWLRQRERVRAFRWPPSGIGDFRWVESAEGRPGCRCWTIRELLSSGALHREGVAMRHCVATFARACARREASIWSMRFEVPGRRYRASTIEVDPRTRIIWQARRHHDAVLTEKHRRVLEMWARQEGLKVQC
jgi:PcfJ-like protein